VVTIIFLWLALTLLATIVFLVTLLLFREQNLLQDIGLGEYTWYSLAIFCMSCWTEVTSRLCLEVLLNHQVINFLVAVLGIFNHLSLDLSIWLKTYLQVQDFQLISFLFKNKLVMEVPISCKILLKLNVNKVVCVLSSTYKTICKVYQVFRHRMKVLLWVL